MVCDGRKDTYDLIDSGGSVFSRGYRSTGLANGRQKAMLLRVVLSMALVLAFGGVGWAIEGDFNGDDKVDENDLARLAQHWQDVGCTGPATCGGADLNSSGEVDLADFAIFATHWKEAFGKVLSQKTYISESSLDGRVWDSAGGGTGIGLDSTDNNGDALRLGDYKDAIWDVSYRSIVSFEITGLPDDAEIVLATLELTRGTIEGVDPFLWGGECYIDVNSPHLGDSSALENKDWEAPADATQVATFAADPGADNAMVSTTFNAAGLNTISTNGRTQMRVYFATSSNSDPNADYLGFYSSENGDPNKRPKLAITYLSTPTLMAESIAADDGIVWDQDGGGAGIGIRSDASDNQALRLGDYQSGTDPNFGYRTIVSFDTSALPDGAMIMSATLELTRGAKVGEDPFGWGGTCNIDVAQAFDAEALEIGDWEAGADAVAVASFSADPGSENAMVSGEFDAAGRNAINKTGKTQLRVYFTTSNNGSGIDYLGFYSGETTLQQKRPKLTIEYFE